MMRDQVSDIEVRRLISPVNPGSGDTAIVSQKIDCANRISLSLVIATGSLSDANATFTVLVEDSPDNSSFTAVDDLYLVGTEAGASFTFTHDDSVRKIGYIGPQRYVRLTITPSGNTGDVYLSAVAILGGSRYLPRSTQSA